MRYIFVLYVALLSIVSFNAQLFGDIVQCHCNNGYLVAHAGNIGDSWGNNNFCRLTCQGAGFTPGNITGIRGYPAITGYAYQDAHGTWHPLSEAQAAAGLDIIKCACANGSVAYGAGIGNDMVGNTNFCNVNCRSLGNTWKVLPWQAPLGLRGVVYPADGTWKPKKNLDIIECQCAAGNYAPAGVGFANDVAGNNRACAAWCGADNWHDGSFKSFLDQAPPEAAVGQKMRKDATGKWVAGWLPLNVVKCSCDDGATPAVITATDDKTENNRLCSKQCGPANWSTPDKFTFFSGKAPVQDVGYSNQIGQLVHQDDRGVWQKGAAPQVTYDVLECKCDIAAPVLKDTPEEKEKLEDIPLEKKLCTRVIPISITARADDMNANKVTCAHICGPPWVPTDAAVVAHPKAAPPGLPLGRNVHWNILTKKWEPSLDVVQCTCNNGAQFAGVGNGRDVNGNNHYCWLNCKAGWTNNNFKVYWGGAPNVPYGTTVYRNSKDTYWTQYNPQYLTLATVCGG